MASGKGPTEEGQRAVTLMEDGAKPDAGCVAVHDEKLVEVRHLEDMPCREGLLQGLKRRGCLCILGKSVTAQEAGQGCNNQPEVPDKFPVVAREAQEAAEGPR